jgi:hypothetical protein
LQERCGFTVTAATSNDWRGAYCIVDFDPLAALVAERDRYRDALEAVAKGNWNFGNVKPGLTVMEYARAALAVSTP